MNLKDRLRRLFYDRAPNTLIFEHIAVEFPNEKEDVIQKALDELVSEGFLELKIYSNDRYPKFQRTGYFISPSHLGEYPITTEIKIGDLKITRMIDGDTARAEDINSIALSFDKIVRQETQQLRDAINAEMKKFWGEAAVVFGIFITIFSIINVAINQSIFPLSSNCQEYSFLSKTVGI